MSPVDAVICKRCDMTPNQALGGACEVGENGEHEWGANTHKLHACDDERCAICIAGLASCDVCTGGEASLPVDCPGRRMTDGEITEVQSGRLDFKQGQWVVPPHKPLPPVPLGRAFHEALAKAVAAHTPKFGKLILSFQAARPLPCKDNDAADLLVSFLALPSDVQLRALALLRCDERTALADAIAYVEKPEEAPREVGQAYGKPSGK